MAAPGVQQDQRPPAAPSKPSYPVAPRRPLRIFAFDPMLGREPDNQVTIDVANEDLLPGPIGEKIKVIDYDGTAKCFYAPIDLNDPSVLLTDGLEPAESNPYFHQQMVFAVAKRVLENFELALGRQLWFRGGRPLRLFPHAFRDANAYYDRGLTAVLFGYFTADERANSSLLPNQTVFTCLSHDIIAHEVTHALVDRLRPSFFDPTNPDVPAFHEAFADIVAIFQHFSFPNILQRTIQETRTDLTQRRPLVELASEFGFATGGGQALRDALDPHGKPDPTLYARAFEPHDRGSVLVDAVFDAFFTVYQKRIADLVRIATGGSGVIPPGALHPDLVNRIADEARHTAESILTMCIRAFDYLPPVDVTFGDFLRALVTADTELVSRDRLGQRAAVIEAFRERGIFPQHVTSLAEGSLVWPDRRGTLPDLPLRGLGNVLGQWARGRDLRGQEGSAQRKRVATALQAYARRPDVANVVGLDPSPDREIAVRGFHAVFRVAPDGQLLTELVAQFVQRQDHASEEERDEYGGLPLLGGATVIASAEGKVRYVISKPLPSGAANAEQRDRAEQRLATQRRFVEQSDLRDPRFPWVGAEALQGRMAERLHLAVLHRRARHIDRRRASHIS